MICLCAGFGCEDAKPYYYDVACPQEEQDIPESVAEHIESCPQCQESIAQLEFLLTNAAESPLEEESKPDVLVAKLLELHLSYLDHAVTCRTAKPFLPTLADDTLRIRVQTPITEHIEACPACQHDVLTIKKLNLSAKQLYRLGQFIADTPNPDEIKKKVQPETLEALALFKTDTISPDEIRIALKLSSARETIQQRRVEYGQTLGAIPTTNRWSCEEIEAYHLFLLALPYPTAGSEEISETDFHGLQDHVRACRHCFKRLQDIHCTLYEIVDRTNSTEITLMSTEAIEERTVAPPSEEAGGGTRHILPFMNWRSGVGAAAAMILVALALFSMLRESAAVAVDYQAMISALDEVMFIKMVHTKAETNEILESIVYDLKAERFLIQQRETETYWDLANKRFIQKELNTGQHVPINVPDDVFSQVRESFKEFHGLLPDRGHLPAGSQWNPIQEDIMDGRRVEIHEFLIPANNDQAHKGDWKRRLVYLLDMETHLPLRMESYQRFDIGEEFILASVTTIMYPDQGQVNDEFEVFFTSFKRSLPDKIE